MKVVNKSVIMDVLKNGGKIKDNLIFLSGVSQVVLVDEVNRVIGSVRYDTFIKFLRDGVIKKCNSSFMFDIYSLVL